jgi:hypothetical protein
MMISFASSTIEFEKKIALFVGSGSRQSITPCVQSIVIIVIGRQNTSANVAAACRRRRRRATWRRRRSTAPLLARAMLAKPVAARYALQPRIGAIRVIRVVAARSITLQSINFDFREPRADSQRARARAAHQQHAVAVVGAAAARTNLLALVGRLAARQLDIAAAVVVQRHINALVVAALLTLGARPVAARHARQADAIAVVGRVASIAQHHLLVVFVLATLDTNNAIVVVVVVVVAALGVATSRASPFAARNRTQRRIELSTRNS